MICSDICSNVSNILLCLVTYIHKNSDSTPRTMGKLTRIVQNRDNFHNVNTKSILLKLNCCVFVCVCLFVRIVLKRWRNKNRTYN